MLQKKVLAQYCEDNILNIPKALYAMKDVQPILFDTVSSIFYKDLEKDLINIEFHTGAPCIVYIKSGKEVITTCHNETFTIGSGEAILLPKELNLYSDYIHESEGLKAFLVFFGSSVISQFLSTGSTVQVSTSNETAILKIDKDPTIATFFSSLHSSYKTLKNSPDILQLKLLELLHLLDLNNNADLRRSLLAVQKGYAKRNIKRLMDQYAISALSVQDLAAVSGRSLSTFNREFKSLYNTSPKQWLIEQRLQHAFRLLSEQQLNVTTVATEVGYSNVSHFIESFKNRFGKTPHQIKSTN